MIEFIMPSLFSYRSRFRIQCCRYPPPVFVATDISDVVVTGFVYEQELTLSFRSLVDFNSHFERHNTIAFSVRH